MSNFDDALKDLLSIESGFVNNSADHGGPTNFGITQNTLANFLGHPVTIEDIQNLDISIVKEIYQKNYWDRLDLDQINDPKLASFIFDQAVNRGQRKVAEQIQKLVNVTQDGIIGQETINAINHFDAHTLLINFLIESQNTYVSIVNADPTQLEFLANWIKRTQRFLTT